MIVYLLLVFSFIFGSLCSMANNSVHTINIDSIKTLIETETVDTLIAKHHLELAKIYMVQSNHQALDHAFYYRDYLRKGNAHNANIKSLLLLAKVYKKFNNHVELDEHIILILSALENIDENAQKATYLYQLGNIYKKKGALIEAQRAFEKSIKIYKKLGLNKDLINPSLSLALVLKDLGNYKSALTLNLKTLNNLKDSSTSLELSAICLRNIAVIYKVQKDYNKAKDYTLKALEIFKSLDSQKARKLGMAGCYNNLGILFKDEGKYEKAKNEYMKALKLYQELGITRFEASVLHNVALVLLKQEKIKEAEIHIKQSIVLKEKSGSSFLMASSLDLLGEIHIKNNQLDLAENCLNEALRLGQLSGSSYALLDIYESLTDLYARKGNGENFRKYWQAYKDISDTLFTTEKTKIVYQLQAKYDLEKETEIKASRQREAQISALNLKNEERYKGEIRRKKERESIITYIFSGLLVLLVVSLYFRYRSSKKIRKELEFTNLELKRTLLSKEEKEVLLKEIHHRVKNNMQIIMSLLRLQSSNIEDEYIQSLYSESQNRIKSMALVHEELYQTTDLTDVSVQNYLEKLINNLIVTYSIKTQIKTSTNINISRLGVDTLIPLGLLLNEIISNSFKHAFTDITNGEIYVRIERTLGGKDILLEVGDNGGGFANDPKVSDSLGFELIESLVTEGVHYKIFFQEQEN